ncbi:MAG TPA: phosphoglycerate kinase [Thermodesulfobacteriota bacterium]|nr:phosphoglycerate kinase [Thermodesulfobacteriota bacterium]
MAIKYIKYIDKINLKGKRVLIRVDFNVPLDKNKNITDDTRIRSALPTINYAIKQDAKIILMSHLGRPKGTPDSEFSLLPVAKYLSQVLQKKVILAPDCIGPEVEKLASEMQPRDILLLENLRFHPEEEKNDREFGRKLSNLADVYINDAFGTAHRAHASNVAVVEFVKEFGGGFLMKNEIEYFRKAMVEPARPLVAIMGGAKVSEKLDALENLIQKVDKIFIGGGMAFTFLAAQGYEVGKSLVEGELIETAKRIMAKAKERKVALLLPVDCVAADQLDSKASTKITSIQEIPPGWMGLDIGPATQVLFTESLADAKTIVWNGPMGVFEMEPFSKGTFAMVKALAESSALTIVGGGDTDVAVHKLNAADKISYISTGGGAFIEILKGKPLPAISVLERTG